MIRTIAKLLNIKYREVRLVRSLFLVQFFLGAAVAFFSTATLTLFLSSFDIETLPLVYLLAAGCLVLFSLLYARFEARYTPARLLQTVVFFSVLSVLVCWLALVLFSFRWLPVLLMLWNMVLYMLVGDAFWGMVALLFNVREGKRLVSIVGAGDLPAKMLGYLSVTALVPFIGVVNLLWVSMACFLAAYVLFYRFKRKAGATLEEAVPDHAAAPHHPKSTSFVARFFQNSLIFSIAVWALIGYTIFFILDFTFLSEIKLEKTTGHELASFISVFFAAGRLLAILFKLIFSNKAIARLGLANALLVAPALLFLVNLFTLLSGQSLTTYLYVFGMMVLLAEVLRSTLQDPVAFVLFQPLDPHSRLKGHAIKGYALPVALLVVGGCLTLYLQTQPDFNVTSVGRMLFVLLIVWAASVFLIRKAYLRILVKALQKGFFTGSELFLNDASVRELLVQKTNSARPLEVIHSLNLLERSGYPDIYPLLLRQLKSNVWEVKEYVLSRIIENNMVAALPLLREQLAHQPDPQLKPLLIRAQYALEKSTGNLETLQQLDPACKKEAMIGLLNHPGKANPAVEQELAKLASGSIEEKRMALDILAEAGEGSYEHLLEALLQDDEPTVYNRALEVAGKEKYFPLVKVALEVAEKRGAYPALQKALLAYGDPAFGEEQLAKGNFSYALLTVLLKVAGKTKGEHATAFLESALAHYPEKTELFVEALWEKKAVPTRATKQLLEGWLTKKLNQALLKQDYYLNLVPEKAAKLLREAICSEIHQDIQSILKGLSLVYDQQRIERVIELYALGFTHKLSNAVEMLEMLIPARYFTGLDALIDFMQEVKHHQADRTQASRTTVRAIISELLLDNKAGCNAWTRSVACYLIPRLQDKSFAVPILERRTLNEDPLFRETRNYVVSMLSQA